MMGRTSRQDEPLAVLEGQLELLQLLRWNGCPLEGLDQDRSMAETCITMEKERKTIKKNYQKKTTKKQIYSA